MSPEYGIRALAKILLNYESNYGINTVRGIVTRWATPSENDTDSYAAHLAKNLGVGLDTPINVRAALPVLVSTIIQHENGLNPYSADTLNRGIAMAVA